jgi:hypothetical protein
MLLKIEKETAKKLYESAPDFFKAQLEDAFGKEAFRKRDFREIKTFKDACDELELTQEDLINITGSLDTPDEVAYKKLKIVIAAINQGWTPDWNNNDERKWWPYFNLSSGFGFSFTFYNYAHSGTSVGSRLCFESSEKAEFAGKQFIDLYKAFLT